MGQTRIMVLNDGTTYSNLHGCKIVEIDDGALDAIENGDASAEDFVPPRVTVLRMFSGSDAR